MKHKNVYLTIVGKSTVASCLEVFKKRINHIPFTSYENMLNLYSEHDLSIIPLDNNPFNNAKSNIKYIEAASQGVPVLARDCNSFVEVIEDGYNGFLYKFDDFYYKLDYIYSNREKLKTIAKNAMDDIQKKHIMETSCFTLINFLKTKLC